MAQKAAPRRADRALLTSRANARPKGSFHPLPWRCAGCVQGAGTRGTTTWDPCRHHGVMP